MFLLIDVVTPGDLDDPRLVCVIQHQQPRLWYLRLSRAIKCHDMQRNLGRQAQDLVSVAEQMTGQYFDTRVGRK
jgi:hypothetical protein